MEWMKSNYLYAADVRITGRWAARVVTAAELLLLLIATAGIAASVVVGSAGFIATGSARSDTELSRAESPFATHISAAAVLFFFRQRDLKGEREREREIPSSCNTFFFFQQQIRVGGYHTRGRWTRVGVGW